MTEEVEKHIMDIATIFPGKLMLTKEELAQLRNTSVATLNRELKEGTGVPHKSSRGRIMYPVRKVAEWLASDIVLTD